MTTANIDLRYMAAAIRLARRHQGLTGTNPSVACVIVRGQGEDARIVGSGVTQLGGRPHAEPVALAEAGELAKGATAYVTLEPCAHHGATPPCAQTLIDAGVARVVTAVVDPDIRVSGKGHAMLQAAGITVQAGLLAGEATEGLSAYLIHKTMKRPQVTLKLAVSADGMLGVKGSGQVRITGEVARAQTHLMRARHHAMLVGIGTVLEDDPDLTCRLPGLETRSPKRVVLDAKGRIALDSKLVSTAREVPVIIACGQDLEPGKRAKLEAAGCTILTCEIVEGRIALPELLDDLAATGVMSVMVEGGAEVARSFRDANLVDEIVLFEGPEEIGKDGITSPLTAASMPACFHAGQSLELLRAKNTALGTDRMTGYAGPAIASLMGKR